MRKEDWPFDPSIELRAGRLRTPLKVLEVDELSLVQPYGESFDPAYYQGILEAAGGDEARYR